MPANKGGAKRPAPRTTRAAASIDSYLAKAPADQRRVLERIRKQVKSIAPRVTESISYGIPTMKLDGKPLIYFGSWSGFCSVYGVPMDLPELAKYDIRKGTIRFTADKPLPASLVAKLVRKRMAEIKAGDTY